MAEVEELLDEVSVRMPSAAQLRARGDRRTARRRSGAVAAVVVAVAGAVTLAVLPGKGTQETRPAKTPTTSQSASVGDTPYKKHGVVKLKRLGGNWWPSAEVPNPPGWVSGCSAVDQVRQPSSGWFSSVSDFQGGRGAKASQRYFDYDRQSDLTTALSRLREAISGCGLTSQGASTGPEGQTVDTYTGTIGHRQVRIVVEYGTRWFYEVQESGGTQGN